MPRVCVKEIKLAVEVAVQQPCLVYVLPCVLKEQDM